jgi:hypothetical protein
MVVDPSNAILINGQWVDKNSPQAQEYLRSQGLQSTPQNSSSPALPIPETKTDTPTVTRELTPEETTQINRARYLVEKAETFRANKIEEMNTLSNGRKITDAYMQDGLIVYETNNPADTSGNNYLIGIGTEGLNQSDANKLNWWIKNNPNTTPEKIVAYQESIVHPTDNKAQRFVLDDRGVYVPQGSFWDTTTKKQVAPSIPSGSPVESDYVVPGNEPILKMRSASDIGVLKDTTYDAAIIGRGTILDNDIVDQSDSRWIPAYDQSQTLIKGTWYDTQEKNLDYAGEVNGKRTFGDIFPTGFVSGKTGEEENIKANSLRFYEEQPVSQYAKAGFVPPIEDRSMVLNGKKYSDPLNAMGIFKLGENITGLGKIPENFARGISNLVPGGELAVTLNTPIYKMQEITAGIAGGLVMGAGAGLGLTEASIQDYTKGDYTKIYSPNSQKNDLPIPNTVVSGFKGGILGEPTKQNNGSTLDMPNLGEQLIMGYAPSLFAKDKGYLQIKENLTPQDVFAGATEIGINTALFYVGARSSITAKPSVTEFVSVKEGLGSPGEIRASIDAMPNDINIVTGFIKEKTNGEIIRTPITESVKEVYTLEPIGIKNTEDGASLSNPWGKNDLINVENSAPIDYLYTPEKIGVTRDFELGYTGKGITNRVSKSDASIEIGQFVDVNWFKEATEPNIKIIDGRELDIAPKSSMEQEYVRPVNPTIEELDFGGEKTVASIIEEPKGWRKSYTVDNYLATMGVNPVDLLFKRGKRPIEESLDFALNRVRPQYEPRFYTVPGLISGSFTKEISKTPSVNYKIDLITDLDSEKQRFPTLQGLRSFEVTTPKTFVDTIPGVIDDTPAKTKTIPKLFDFEIVTTRSKSKSVTPPFFGGADFPSGNKFNPFGRRGKTGRAYINLMGDPFSTKGKSFKRKSNKSKNSKR